MSQRILVIQLKRIGDFVLTIPALAALHQARPDAELVVIVPAPVAALAAGLPWLSKVIAFSPGKLNFNAWGTLTRGPWDACLDFTGNDRSALMTLLSRAKSRVGYEKFAVKGLRKWAYNDLSPASLRNLHTVDFHHNLVEAFLGSEVEAVSSVDFRFEAGAANLLEEKIQKAGLNFEQPYAIIHPGTARVEKFWLDERWVEVAEYLHRRLDFQVVLTGTGVGLEEVPLTQIKKNLNVPVVDLCGLLSLPEMMMLIRKAQLVVGVDSMAMHLAALAERPQVALFGPTNPFHWRARHGRAITLQGNSGFPLTEFSPKCERMDMNQISTAAVIDAISAAL